jgi:mannose-6-phosphate isomerase-like protein (cupin superfamily)
VKHVETLLETSDVRIAEFEMAPATQGPRHYHSKVSESCICLAGQLLVHSADGSRRMLEPGERMEVPAREIHRLVNAGAEPCRYLVIQYGGTYDFIDV